MKIVGTVVTEAGLAKLARPPRGVDWIEVRVDALRAEGLLVAEIVPFLRKRKAFVLLTCRAPEEGGLHAWERGERTAALRQLLPLADAVDIELANLSKLQEHVAAARRLRKKLVLSVHSLKKPASPAQLKRWAAALRRAKPDVAKIAVKIETQAGLQALTARLLEESKRPGPRWALMGTGPQAAQSRLVLRALGSELVYGYLDQPAAPGQPSAASLTAPA